MPSGVTSLLASVLLLVITWALYLETRELEDDIKSVFGRHKPITRFPRIGALSARSRNSRRSRKQSSTPSFTTHAYLPEYQRSFVRSSGTTAVMPASFLPSDSPATSVLPEGVSTSSRVNSKDSGSGILNTLVGGTNATHVSQSKPFVGSSLQHIKEDEVLCEGRSLSRTALASVSGEVPERDSGVDSLPHVPENLTGVQDPCTLDDRTHREILGEMIREGMHVLSVLFPVLLISLNAMIMCCLFASWIVVEAHVLSTFASLCVTMASLIYLFRFNLVYMKGLAIVLTVMPE